MKQPARLAYGCIQSQANSPDELHAASDKLQIFFLSGDIFYRATIDTSCDLALWS